MKKKMIFHNTIYINSLVAINISNIIGLLPLALISYILPTSLSLFLYMMILPIFVGILVNKNHFSDINNISDAREYNVNDDSNLLTISIISLLFNALPIGFALYMEKEWHDLGILLVTSILYDIFIFFICWSTTLFNSLMVLNKNRHYKVKDNLIDDKEW